MTWLLYACGAGLSVALTAFFAKAGAKKGDASLAAAIGILAAGIFSFVMSKESILQGKYAGIGIKTWIFIALSGIIMGLAALCFFQAIKQAEITQVVPMGKCHIVISLLIGVFFLHEKLSTNKMIAIALIIIGTLIMVLVSGTKNFKWIWYGIGVAILWSASDFLVDYGVTGVGSGLLRFLRLLIAGILVWTVALTAGGKNHLRNLSFLDGIFLCFSGGCFGLSKHFFQRACQYADEQIVTAVYRLNLLMLVILATIFLKEKISGKVLLGAILMIAGFELLLVKTAILPL